MFERPRWLRALAACAGVGLAGVVGCVTRSDRPRLPPPPADPSVDRLVVGVSPPQDSDADGTFDLVQASVHFFDDAYPQSVAASGRMTAQIRDVRTKRELYAWSFESDAVDESRRVSPVGPVHWLDLRMDPAVAAWVASDLSSPAVDLRLAFEPANGGPVVGRVVESVPWTRR